MLIKQTVNIRWNNRYRKHYEDLGYTYTKQGDTFTVRAEELTKRSKVRIKYICDYCGEENTRRYDSYMSARDLIAKDSCGKRACMVKKQNEVANYNRIKSEGSLASKQPSLLEEWSGVNKKTPHDYVEWSNEKVVWKCSKGHVWMAEIYRRAIYGSGCPFCAGQRATSDNNLEITHAELLEQWCPTNKETPKEFMGGSNRKVWWVCDKGHRWEASIINRTKAGTGCPVCKESKGEKAVRTCLERLGVDHKSEFEFSDLKGIGGQPLRFDFVTFDGQGNILLIIEYDGEFHFEPQYDVDKYLTLVKHDKIKDDYCEKNKIPLLRIPYTEYERIDEVIEEVINEIRSDMIAEIQ